MAGCICYFLIMSSGCRQTPCPASDASTFEQYCLRTAPFGWYCSCSSQVIEYLTSCVDLGGSSAVLLPTTSTPILESTTPRRIWEADEKELVGSVPTIDTFHDGYLSRAHVQTWCSSNFRTVVSLRE
ncbi:hypothetical protein EV401DRAFT_1923995 [Pisolithus croceorrhizus]|nr:hypothetical protein EV401DRAFT_1923995 [Pisolithus croceorrhizus]